MNTETSPLVEDGRTFSDDSTLCLVNITYRGDKATCFAKLSQLFAEMVPQPPLAAHDSEPPPVAHDATPPKPFSAVAPSGIL